MTLAVVRSIGAPRRLETAQEYEDFEQELVDQFLLAGLGAGLSDGSITDDRRAIFEFIRFLCLPVWTAGPQDADRFLTDQRKAKKLAHSTVQRKAWTLAQFFEFLIVRYQGDVHALTGHVLVQPIDEFNRPAKSEYGTPRIPPTEADVDQLFAGWREPVGLAHSLTWDQGSEMSRHDEFTRATGIPVYFCEPASPWQRGSNENTNGLLRQYFPKSTDLSIFSAEDLAFVAAELNSRPRRTLGWQTPADLFAQLVATLG